MSADVSELEEEGRRTNQDAVGRAVEDVADLFGDDCHCGRKGSISSAERCRVLLRSACKTKGGGYEGNVREILGLSGAGIASACPSLLSGCDRPCPRNSTHALTY